MVNYKKKRAALMKELLRLEEQLADLDRSEFERIKTCDHIFVSQTEESFKGGKYQSKTYYSCIKCGLTNKFMGLEHKREATALQGMMNDLLLHSNVLGTYLDLECDPDVAMDVYSEIKEKNSSISEEEAIREFKKTLKITEKTKKLK